MTETRIIEWLGTLDAAYHLAPSRDIYYAWLVGENNPWLLHYCLNLDAPEYGTRWVWSRTGLHTLVSKEPLHLEASIGWMECCGRHGWIRNGKWEPADDGGWRPE